MKNLISFTLFCILVGCQPQSNLVKPSEVIFKDENLNIIGPKWSRKIVNLNQLEDYSPHLQRLFSSIAKVVTPTTSGTSFYIGKHSGEYLFATNHHVLMNQDSCVNGTSVLVQNSFMGFCKKVIVSWPDVDIALFTVTLPKLNQEKLDEFEPLEFDFSNEILFQEKLVTAGFGRFQNNESYLTYTDDEFCMQVSGVKRHKRIEAPSTDSEMKEPKKTWSFMHGCEGSPGDSGAPLMSRETGKIVGLYWGGKNPKGNRFYSEEYVKKIIKERSQKIIWNKFNMGVPVTLILEKIQKILKTNDFGSDNNDREILESLIK